MEVTRAAHDDDRGSASAWGVEDPHDELPVDPDVAAEPPVVPVSGLLVERPVHLRPAMVGWVALGGVAGAAARIGVVDALPRPDGLPVPTLAVNLVGALVLGVLLEALARRGPDAGVRRLTRLGLGTGFCGAFTTYSSFAVDTGLLLRGGRPGASLAYVAVTVLVGLGASALGVWAAAAHHRRAGTRAGRS